jgi:hypothetical protein
MLSRRIPDRRSAADFDVSVPDADSVAPPVVRDNRGFLLVRGEQRFSRAAVTLSVARLSGERYTCSEWQGVCVEDRLARIPLDSSEKPSGAVAKRMPYAMTGQYVGGETYRTHTARADLVANPSDRHQMRFGVSATRHSLEYADVMGYRYRQGNVLTEVDVYRARPMEFASYFQTAIEHDILSVHVGARFEYRYGGGVAFANPLNPTNGTTALEVCNGEAPGLSDTPFTYGNLQGIAACMGSPGGEFGRPVLLDSATRIAQRDDFRPVRRHATFAPRVALSFPLTEQSGMFVNAGHFHAQAPYHHAYRNFGTGSRAGLGSAGDGMCDAWWTRAGSNECSPNLRLAREIPEFVGNPDLSPEVSTVLEAGFSTMRGRAHSLDVSVFTNSQGYLPRLYQVSLAPDIGVTYGVLSRGTQRTVLSTGSASTQGVSVTVRRRREHVVTYSANYTWLRSQEIGANPDLVAEALVEGEPSADELERVSSRGHGHSLSGMLALQWGPFAPTPFAVLGRAVLRNSRTTLTAYVGGGGPEAQTPTGCLFTTIACAAFEGGSRSTGVLADLFYARTLTTGATRVAFVLRIRNLLNVDDGSTELRMRRVAGSLASFRARERAGPRRMIAGVAVDW